MIRSTRPAHSSGHARGDRFQQNDPQLRLLAAAVHHAEDSILITTTALDLPGPEIVFVNPAFTKLTGYTAEDAIGKTPRILQGPKTDREMLGRLRKTLERGEIFYGEAINYRKDGTPFYNEWHIEPICDEAGNVTHYLAIQRDVTARRYAENELRYAAYHDALTGLPNRAFFCTQLQTAIEHCHEDPEAKFSVLFLDLDLFKLVNDSLGHQAGDELLCEIAQRLQQVVCEPHIVARLGGDEFAMLLSGLNTTAAVDPLVRTIHQAIAEPIYLGDRELLPSVSIGIAYGSTQYTRGEDILRDADLAMYRAKAQGKSRAAVFTPALHEQALARLNWEQDLRQALARDELLLYYQPIIDLSSDRLKGFEALVRWQHPQQGFISPGDFIPIAEETGLIVPLGEWVLRQAAQQLQQWQEQFGLPHLSLNVNVASAQLAQTNFVSVVARTLHDTQLSGRSLNLEITESALLDLDLVSSQLSRLKALGVTLSVDDFGTGYSSLSRLHNLPIDNLKIDRAFISSLGSQADGSEIARTIVTLAHNLTMTVTAEGIETERQMRQLQRWHCNFGQGYLFSRPVTAQAASAMLRSEKSPMSLLMPPIVIPNASCQLR